SVCHYRNSCLFHICIIYFSCFFFFQAEDGIRYFHVTGVQTCALPISSVSAKKAGVDDDGPDLFRPFSQRRKGRNKIPRAASFKERRQLQLRLRGKFASMFGASFWSR